MSKFRADVVIVGGGFAGITAARELTQSTPMTGWPKSWLGRPGRCCAPINLTVLTAARAAHGRLRLAGSD
jgi:glycine/D-amino acid oxidase-like deaminating enzyme